MKEEAFVSKNTVSWDALDAYNRHIAKVGVRNLSHSETKEFARLFRLASHHLAYARTHYPKSNAVPQLNKLVAVSHNYMFVRQGRGIADVWGYFSRTFPAMVRETWVYWGIATILFFIGVFFAGFYIYSNPSRLNEIMPAAFASFAEGEVPDWGDGGIDVHYTLFAASVTTNNIAVSFNAIAGGLLLGLGSVFILVYNGLIVGGLFGFFYQVGANMLIAYALVLPHGIIELMAIFLCGGCGLMIAKGMLVPGNFTRRHSLVVQFKRVAAMIPGIVIMLVVAGIIEGYFTPLPIHPWLKIAFAALTGVAMVAYFTRGIYTHKPGE